MAYSKTNWVNGGPPALSAENLNNMEDSIANSSEGVLEFDEEATSGTPDGDLYAALVALGWDGSPIIV